MQISIAMATYNGAKYLQQQLDSFLNQTHQPDELVVCDDGSTDETIQILSDFAKNAPFEIKLHRNPSRLGYAENFMKALALSSGDIIFFSDQDDYWLERKIELVADAISKGDSVLMTVNNMIIADQYLLPSGKTTFSNLKTSGGSLKLHAYGCAMALRKDFAELLNPLPTSVKDHDQWALQVLTALGQTCLYLPEPLQLYRRHSNNTSMMSTTSTTKTLWPWSNFFHRLIRGFFSRKKINMEFDLQIEANKRAKSFAQLEIGIQQIIDSRVSALKARKYAIEANSVSQRLARIIKTYQMGHYEKCSGIKSALRDLLCW